MKVNFHEIGSIDEGLIKFVVIRTKYKDKWVYSRHKERDTWEMQGGHIEAGESIIEAAKRELYEESGALDFEIEPVYDYSVVTDERTTYGRAFRSTVFEMGGLPDREMEEVRLFDCTPDNLTYPYILTELIRLLG